MKKMGLLLLLSIMGGMIMAQQKFSVSGTLRDAKNGETLIGATILVKSLGIGTTTNVYGYYSLEIPEGSYELEYSFIGYESTLEKVTLTENLRIDKELSDANVQLDEVTIEAEAKNENVQSVQMSKIKMPINQIKKIPAIFGEVDIIKAIQLLPGVSSAGEGFSGFFVRGGGADQNLVLLDEATVYNASHLFGFFSVFNPDAIKDVQLYKGGIPARYGGRLASVLDIRMKEGNSKEFAGSGGIGLIASRLTLEAPINKGRGSILASGRRTYADMFLFLAKNPDLKNNKLYFYDFNLKGNYKLGENDRIFASGYFGRDVFAIQGDLARFNWGNGTGTVRWNHIYNPKLFSNLTLIYSNYDYELGAKQGVSTFSWKSNIEDISAKLDFSYFKSSKSEFKFGYQGTLHRFDPGKIRIKSTENQDFSLSLSNLSALEHGIYVEHQYEFNELLSATYGLRYSLFQNLGGAPVYSYDENFNAKDTTTYAKNKVYNTQGGLEPRLGLRYKLTEESSIKAGYNRMIQYVQLASNATASSPLDIWFPASQNVKPQLADQIAAGYFRNFQNNMYEGSVELYYKWMQNAIDFKNQAELLLNEQLEGELRTGDAKSYGAEFLVRKNKGKLTGFISYTLAKTEREIDVDERLPGKEVYPASYDKRHDLAVIASYELNKRLSFGGNFVYSSGVAATLPSGKYIYKGSAVPIYTSRNGARLPAYHRLDLSVTLKNKEKPSRKHTGEWVLSVYNVYNRHNVFNIVFSKDPNNPDLVRSEKTYLFGVIPSITYNFKF